MKTGLKQVRANSGAAFAQLAYATASRKLQKQVSFCSFFYPQVGVVLGLILVPNGKHFGKMLGDEYSHYEPQ